MSTLAPRDVLVGLIAVRRGLIPADELDSVLLSSAREGPDALASSLRQRLGVSLWAELLQSAEQRLSGAGSIPAIEIPPPHPEATVVEKSPGGPAEPGRPDGPPPPPPRYSRSRR